MSKFQVLPGGGGEEKTTRVWLADVPDEVLTAHHPNKVKSVAV
jgi:hypothetical protein